MLNILVLSTWFPYPPDNGSKIRANYLLRALASLHSVTAVAFCPDATDGRVVAAHGSAAPSVTVVCDDPFRYVNAPRWVKYLSPSPLVFRPSPAMQTSVAHMAGPACWDAVVAIQVPVAQYTLRVNALARVIDVDTALSFQMRERFLAQTKLLAQATAWISWQKARTYENRTLRRFQAAVVASPVEIVPLEYLVRGANCQVSLLPNGVDCQHNQLGLAQPQRNALVYNGSLTYSANYDAMRWFLAEVYPRIKVEQPDVSLTITGSTNGVDLAGLILDDTVRLTGFVDDVRLPVAQAAVCVAPIRQGGGTRLKILEAMALGTPVVATAKGAEGLDVVDGEHLLLANDPERFARHTVALLSDTDLRQRLAVNARRLVQARYDWEQIGKRFVTLVEEAVATRSTQAVKQGIGSIGKP